MIDAQTVFHKDQTNCLQYMKTDVQCKCREDRRREKGGHGITTSLSMTCWGGCTHCTAQAKNCDLNSEP